MKRWLDLADSDGAKQRHEDAHTQRSASIVDVGEETVVRATCGAARGEIMRAIFDAFCDAEFAVDRDLAGPGGILARTDSQRRADALLAIFEAAARGGHGGKLEIVVNYVVDRETFERELRAGLGAKVDRLDPATLERRRCETLRGTQIQPADAVAAALIGTVRRVVLGAGSVVIDLGRQRRFTGSARHALLLRDRHCVYAGCTVPAHHAEGDHVLEHGRGGLTNPRNGSLQCPRHNRFKNHGYRTVRDEHGHWHTYRPDGSEVGRPLTTV